MGDSKVYHMASIGNDDGSEARELTVSPKNKRPRGEEFVKRAALLRASARLKTWCHTIWTRTRSLIRWHC